jgi:hypothetical protein
MGDNWTFVYLLKFMGLYCSQVLIHVEFIYISLYRNFKILGTMSLDTETMKLDFQKRKWAPQQMHKP